MDTQRFQRLIARIDQLNAEDPRRVIVDGVERPFEQVYAERVTAWVLRLDPRVSEWIQIAAKGQHVQRWKIARDSYPRTTAGYLRWREALKAFHAQTVAGLMRQEQYNDADIEQVVSLILKRPSADKAQLQVLEDALCLVFLETQLEELKLKVADARLREVVRKTWGKMSEQARQEALKLPLDSSQRAWLIEAVAS